jgi:hypothetical protein
MSAESMVMRISFLHVLIFIYLFIYLLVIWAKLDSLLNTKSVVDDAPLLLLKIPYIESVVYIYKKGYHGMHNIFFNLFQINGFFLYSSGCPG